MLSTCVYISNHKQVVCNITFLKIPNTDQHTFVQLYQLITEMPDCTSNTWCDECRLASTRVHPCIVKDDFICPKDACPVIYTLSFKGSNSDAKELLRVARERFKYTFRGGLPVDGAVREAAKDNGESESQWQDLDGTIAMDRLNAVAREEIRMEIERWQDAEATSFSHRHGRYQRPSALRRAGRWIGLLVPNKMDMEPWHDRHRCSGTVMSASDWNGPLTPAEREIERIRAAGARERQREMSILAVFPVDVQAGDSFDKVFCVEFGDEFTLTNRSPFSDSGHASLHYLNWLAMVHPEDKPDEDEPEDEPEGNESEEDEHEEDE